ncbi:MAG: hypothetical protein IE910_00160 [Brevundimonas sp.]|nr:hypothetical protein [Brevundimonas sp.]
MRRLICPTYDDDKRQAALALKRGIGSVLLTRWQKAYRAYRRSLGNPFKVVPFKKSRKFHLTLYKIYDQTKYTKVIADIRKLALSTCPMCGAAGVGTVDHYLPRETYPEFSVFTPNLVPACGTCNSKAKRTTVSGPSPGQRFLHPYFNKIVGRDLWQVRFHITDTAVTFSAEPLPTLSASTARRVQWHLENVLEDQFQNLMGSNWADHARGLNKALARQGLPTMTAAFVRSETADRLSYEETGDKHNSWVAAFYRGILNDPHAIAWMVLHGPAVI